MHLAQRLDDLQTRSDGHVYIRDDEVNEVSRFRVDLLRDVHEEPPTVRHRGYFIPVGPKRLGKKAPELCVVLGEKHVVRSWMP